MHVVENRIGIAAVRHIAQIESNGVERSVDAAMVAAILQAAVLA